MDYSLWVLSILIEIKSLENFKMSRNGNNSLNISWESFQKIQKLPNFKKAKHSTKNLKIPGGKSNETENSG